MTDDAPRRRRLTARARALVVSAASLVILLAIALLLPVPYVRLAPGPTFNVIGEKDGTPVLLIDGTATYPTTGELFMTTVLESGGPRGGLTFVQALASWLNPADAVLPRELLYPDDVSGEQVRSQQAVMFSTAESDAIAAAMRYLDRPVSSEVIVSSVTLDSPADGTLQPGDRIRAIDGVEVTTPAQVREQVRSQPPGTTFRLDIERLDVEGSAGTARVGSAVEITSAPNPEDPSLGYLGIAIGERVEPGFDIDFTLKDIGGPSAGLMFSLGLVDKLTPEDLAAGRSIAGTGTIDPDGTVGPIGGIRQKLAGARDGGAELFLAPKVHCAEIDGHVPDGLTVAAVETLTDAVRAVRDWTAGRAPVGCGAAAAAP